ncbi:MAG: hypothetical protein NTX53_12810 [candidate division WOR-3 bacterium]|nr:hypothetical protein [candidate division WOR-3 bacterium]
MNTSPDPSPSIASPRVALDDGLQDPDGLRTEAAERNNVAKTTILHACSTESPENHQPGNRESNSVGNLLNYSTDCLLNPPSNCR